MDVPHDAQPQPPQEDGPVEPGENDEVNDNPPQVEPAPVPGLLHIVDQRTIEMKDILDRTIDGLEQVCHQQRTVLNELREQADFLQGLVAQPPPSASPQSGPSGAEGQYQRLRCAFCDDYHHACDCKAYKTLGERKLRAFERIVVNDASKEPIIWLLLARTQAFVTIVEGQKRIVCNYFTTH
ncbi:unnamed protein product [Haemonchus placei]|uniref:Uncharacterized protein n=1 Tax=Haemonchus placei TaxID=6290 RepID=A0A0N4W322_HAEPC|nr:unnamed protein product [Haemonchus placei]